MDRVIVAQFQGNVNSFRPNFSCSRKIHTFFPPVCHGLTRRFHYTKFPWKNQQENSIFSRKRRRRTPKLAVFGRRRTARTQRDPTLFEPISFARTGVSPQAAKGRVRCRQKLPFHKLAQGRSDAPIPASGSGASGKTLYIIRKDFQITVFDHRYSRWALDTGSSRYARNASQTISTISSGVRLVESTTRLWFLKS